MNGGARSTLLPLALAALLGALLAAGCRTEEERKIPPPFNPPYSSIPPPVPDKALVSGQPIVDPAVRPASAIAQLPPAGPPGTAPPGPLPGPASTEIIPAPAQPLAPPPLSLFDAVELGLTQNPDLIALRYAQDASEGALGVAETYPFNPWVQIQVTPSQRSADPLINDKPVNHYVLLMQQLQLAHQREHRTSAAAATLNSVRWNYVQAELMNVAQTQRLYFTALYQRGIAELARANGDLNNQLLAISEKQLQGGAISGADVAILRLDNASTRRQARLAEANYQTALLDLKRQLGIAAHVPVELSGRLADWRWQELSSDTQLWSKFVCLDVPVKSDRAWLARSLASARPDVWAANADVDAARANLDLARANRVPDLQIGPYYQRNNDPVTYWGFRAQMDIPVLNTGNPMVRQRLAELTQRQAIWEQSLNRATLDAQAAIDRYDRALAIAEGSEFAASEELPPELRMLEEQFKAGEVDVVRVVTARTSFFNARRAALDTLNELAQASANLVAATGLPPEAILGPSGQRNP